MGYKIFTKPTGEIYSNPKSIAVGVIHELPLPSGLNLKKYDNSNRIAIYSL
ncbi:hypothetical protein PLAN_70403 [Planktothrix rubescens CCAP 1459/22]|uniref:Uncharacterized protein n=1 Tax=Planktothrix rubescens CCAP 1459/22 TaxID=329571 RepID=A0A6J7ZTW2_PLARU|nr:hypothetical protein PLAN_70403 [Planktothrix rubescens NIVA-CYA 18]